MEYLLDRSQSESAAQILGEGLTAEILEREIENLRADFYRILFSSIDEVNNLVDLSNRAYLLATLVVDSDAIYGANLVGKVLSVAALIFEYLSELSPDIYERFNYALNAILFYSRGEQEAQAATVARKMLKNGLINNDSRNANTQQCWHLLLLFFGRELKEFLKWGRDSSEEFFVQLSNLEDDGIFWVELLTACLNIAKYMVWGVQLDYAMHFDRAINEAQVYGNTRHMWLALTVKEVSEVMTSKSIRKRLVDLDIPEWVSEVFTMESLVEMWLPHREAFKIDAELNKGILSDDARISLINMPPSAGKSLVAEIVILSQLTKDTNSKAIWVVPSRALVFEVQSRLRNRFRKIGINVSSLPGGLETDPEDSQDLSLARVFILTPEKLDGLLRRHPDLFDSISVVVVDEMHKIGDFGRGWLLETVIAWLLMLAEQHDTLRILFMSAVLPNRPEFEVWLRQQEAGFALKWVSWRPTRLALFVTSGGGRLPWSTVLAQRHTIDLIKMHDDLERYPRAFVVPAYMLNILSNQRNRGTNTLIFFYTKDDVNNFVSSLSQWVTEPDVISPVWEAISLKFERVYGPNHHFTLALKRGVGVDHADIPLWLRHLVETAFRRGELPVLVANQAILEGVNFPIDDLIIGSLGSRAGQTFHYRLRVEDYTNLVGRVGRAMVDTEGRCFLLWNYYYEGVSEGNLSWEAYCVPQPPLEDIRSCLAINESEFVEAIRRLTSSLEGIYDAAFDDAGIWRDRLERLHSVALTLLDRPGTVDYSHLSRWIEKTLAWQQLGEEGKAALRHYTEFAWRWFRQADMQLYRIASLSGLSVSSARDIQSVARSIIDNWVEGNEPHFESIFTPETFDEIVNIKECWRRRPVTYSTHNIPPRIDHYHATSSWIRGESWPEVINVICTNYPTPRYAEKTRTHIVAAYVSQMFEFRLPWVLGAFAIAVRELGGPDELCKFMELLPSYVRYGVNSKEAVSISKLCRAEREIALILANKYLEETEGRKTLRNWLCDRSLDDIQEWIPSEPEILRKDLIIRLQGIRERDWTLRRSGTVAVEIAGWTHYDWSVVANALMSGQQVEFVLLREFDNPFDLFAVAIYAKWDTNNVQIGYVPASHSEEVAELLDWGRDIQIILESSPSLTPPKIQLRLVAVV